MAKTACFRGFFSPFSASEKGVGGMRLPLEIGDVAIPGPAMGEGIKRDGSLSRAIGLPVPVSLVTSLGPG
jgi:hypothetical protein